MGLWALITHLYPGIRHSTLVICVQAWSPRMVALWAKSLPAIFLALQEGMHTSACLTDPGGTRQFMFLLCRSGPAAPSEHSCWTLVGGPGQSQEEREGLTMGSERGAGSRGVLSNPGPVISMQMEQQQQQQSMGQFRPNYSHQGAASGAYLGHPKAELDMQQWRQGPQPGRVEQHLLASSTSSLPLDVITMLRSMPPGANTDVSEDSDDHTAEGATLATSTSHGSTDGDASRTVSLQLASPLENASEVEEAWLMGRETQEGMGTHSLEPDAGARPGMQTNQDGWHHNPERNLFEGHTAEQRMQGLDTLLRSHGYAALIANPGKHQVWLFLMAIWLRLPSPRLQVQLHMHSSCCHVPCANLDDLHSW